MAKFSVLFSELENLVRMGNLRAAARKLRALRPARVSREERLRLAHYARRCGEINLGLRWLYRAIFPLRGQERATGPEIAEYAILLTLNGDINEALGFLERESCVEALIAKAWCHFERWEHDRAVPLLNQYIKGQSDPYFLAAGRVNLAEAFLETREFSSCIGLLGPVLEWCREQGHVRLLANGLHIQARAFFEMGKVEISNEVLQEAVKLFGAENAADAILIRRQMAINTGKPEVLRAFRAQAVAWRAWESARECDFQLLRLKFSKARWGRLYFGTPYVSYHKRMSLEFPSVSVPARYIWGVAGARCLDIEAATLDGKTVSITRQNRALLDILLRDFYAPLRIGAIFSALFQGEHYDCFSSPDRVHQALKRLRQWFKVARVPLRVDSASDHYLLQTNGAISLRIPAGSRQMEKRATPLELLRLKVAGEFSAREAARVLRVSKATINRYLTGAVGDGMIERIGRGRMVRYKLTAQPS